MQVTKQTLYSVTLTQQELEYIRQMTQNSWNYTYEKEEPKDERDIRYSLFNGASEALGYNTDGSLNRRS